MKTPLPAGFLNVDLEIESADPLDLLGKEMGSAVVVLYSGPGKGKRHLYCLETSRWSNTADAAARMLCSAIEQLSADGRRLWDHAKRKEFDVGCGLPSGARAVHITLQQETLKRILALGATVAFTCYRDDSEDSVAKGSQPIRQLKK